MILNLSQYIVEKLAVIVARGRKIIEIEVESLIRIEQMLEEWCRAAFETFFDTSCQLTIPSSFETTHYSCGSVAGVRGVAPVRATNAVAKDLAPAAHVRLLAA
jgi:hypothetical protein